MYADETVIYTSYKSFSTIKSNLTEGFTHVATWLEENQLIVSLRKGKTECMLFGTSQRTKNKTLDEVHHHRTLSETNSFKYLGVQLHQNLNIRNFAAQTYKKACSRLQLLKRLRPKLTTKATATIYQSMILPLVTYCSLVTYSSKSYIKKANPLHSRADQIIGNNAKQYLLKPIDSTMKRHLCKQVFKILICESFCSVFKDYFETMENNTRNIIRLPHSVASCKTRSLQEKFKFNGGKMFHSLPHKCRAATSLDDFLKVFDELQVLVLDKLNHFNSLLKSS